MLSNEIKRLGKEKPEEYEKIQKDKVDKIESLKRDFDTLKNMKSEGFIKNMKDVIYA